MRTNEERIAAMHVRAAELNTQKRANHVRILQSAGAAVSFAAVILLALSMPNISAFGPGSAAGSPNDMHASIFGESSALGYVVISVIAFLLGTAVTIFCFRLKRWQDEKGEKDIQ